MFEHIEEIPADPILGVTEAFRKDTSPKKVNLGVGVYQNGDAQIPVLDCVRQAALKWLTEEDNKTYLPIEGVPVFVDAVKNLLFGADSAIVKDKRVVVLQSVGGSGALRLGAEFIRRFIPNTTIFLSDPSWENHKMLLEASGLPVAFYPYYEPKTGSLNYSGMVEAIGKAPEGSVLILHVCCHNPTGIDLTQDQWKGVIDIIQKRNLLPFFDFAYQGFGSGVDEDAWVVREFAKLGRPFLLANSFAKSFSIYRERVGALSIGVENAGQTGKITSQMKRIVRTINSSPPSYGAQLVGMILSTPEMKKLWLSELGDMRNRLLEMRQLFAEGLASRIKDRDFSFITKQRGMFSYSGLSKENINALSSKYHIYALESGRICVGALNKMNLEYVCDSIASVLHS